MRGLLTGFALLAVAFVVMDLYERWDTASNYEMVTGTITGVEKRCAIIGHSIKIVDTATGAVALHDCTGAPATAALYDLTASDIRERTLYTYTFVSPVDGTRHAGSWWLDRSEPVDFAKGDPVDIHAHLEEAATSRPVHIDYAATYGSNGPDG